MQVRKVTFINSSKITHIIDVGTLVIDSVQFEIGAPMNPSKMHLTSANLLINVEPEIRRELKYNLLESHDNKTGWFRNNLYFPLMMRYRSALYIHLSQRHSESKVTACLWMKEIYDNDWQEVTIGLRPFTELAAADELPWGSEGPCGKIKLRLKFVPGFSPAHTELPEFTTDMLGADPFQNDITRDKAHLLVRQEGTENYAVNIPSEKKIHQPHVPTTDDINNVSLLTPPEQNYVEQNKVNTQDHTSPVILQQEPHYPVVEEREGNQEAPITNSVMSNREDRRPSTANVSFNTGNDRNSRGSMGYNVNDRRTSNLTGTTLNSDYRRTSASTGTSFDSENDTMNRRLDTSTGNKLNEIVEVETVGYLEAMEQDLENSKIRKHSLMRKLTKGKDRFFKKFKTLSQGYNSQTRANKAIVEEA